ncbi:MAG: hypothetical protein K2G89_09795, partial [Lachnospiraceae bacterium]|nr:hypothetical protein [Lachnospiraceae bacterium]
MMGKRKKNRKKVWTAILMCQVLLLSGCSSAKSESVPELVESNAFNDSYRMAVYGNVGDIGSFSVLSGVVVPEENCYFFNATAKIDDIYVNIGDYVEAGTVLASIRIDGLRESIQDMEASLKYRRALHDEEIIIYEQTMKKYDYQIKALKELAAPSASIRELKLEKEKEKENHVYSELLYERECREMTKEISELKTQLAEGQLVARQSGYVTYVKDLEQNTDAEPSENVVILSNYNKRYIEIQDVTMEDTSYTKAEQIYTNYNGQKYSLTPYQYTKEVLAMIQASKIYPYLKYEIPEGMELEVGDMVSVCFAKKSVSNVLMIGKDSIFEEGNDKFVYVKTENNSKERRQITTGAEDAHYVEVTEGLSEGEMVYYSSLAMMPSKYVEVTAELSDYVMYASTSRHSLSESRKMNFFAVEDAIVSEVLVSVGDSVKEGDLMLRVKAQGGKADLLAAKDALEAENQAYKETGKAYRKQMKEIEKQIEAAKEAEEGETSGSGSEPDQTSPPSGFATQGAAPAETSDNRPVEPEDGAPVEDNRSAEPEHGAVVEEGETSEDNRPAEAEEDTPAEDTEAEEEQSPELTPDQLYQTEQLTCDKKMAAAQYRIATINHKKQAAALEKTYNELKKMNDGNGYKNIYAEHSGTVEEIWVGAGDRLYPDKPYLSISQPANKLVYVTMAAKRGEDASYVRDKKGAALNQKLLFETKDSKYTGICVAAQSYTSKTFFTEIDGQVYASHNPDDPL